MLTKERKKDIRILAEKIRLETLKSILCFGAGHIGGSLSIVETLAVLYGEVMNYDPGDLKKEDRDRFVLSKGHAGPALYSTLALCGCFPIEDLKSLNQPGTNLPSHCDMNKTPGIDMSSGSLGQGLSVALGMAMASRVLNLDFHVYAMIGDGECNEGQIWEAVLMAAHHNEDRLIAFLDRNMMQLDGTTEDICKLGDMGQKFKDFGWNVEQANGHDIDEIYQAIVEAKSCEGKPSIIILDTIKGLGAEFAVGTYLNHYMRIDTEDDRKQWETAIAEAEQNVSKAESE